MNARERIFSKVEEATRSLSGRTKLPPLSDVTAIRSRTAPSSDSIDELERCFERAWNAVRGKLVRSENELIVMLKAMGVCKGYVDVSVEIDLLESSFELKSRFDREIVDTYDFGISRATCGVAETGTIALLDRDTPNRLGALAPWVHVAVLEKSDLRSRLIDAFEYFARDPSASL